MYVNKCIKCGAEFETKNPKRVICPNCLYPDKNMMPSDGGSDNNEQNQQQDGQQNNEEQQNQEYQGYSSDGGYSAGGYSTGGYSAGGYSSGGYDKPRRNNYNQGSYQSRGGYNQDRQGSYQSRGGYNNNGYQQRNNYNQGGYQSRGGYSQDRQGSYQSRGGYSQDRQSGYQQRNNYNQGGYQSRGGYNNDRQGGYQQRRPQSGNFSRGGSRPQGGFNRGSRPQRPQRPQQPKQLLVSKEQLEQIELLYKAMLPLPNPDAHEVIGEQIGLEPRKVFFGINLIRQKMMLPKLPFPKRKLAISPDQLLAIRSLYEPLLPLPPIGCHKIIAVQLKMDEWRVHVGIGLIRSQMGLERWNQEREDAPEEFKKSAEPVKETKTKKTTKAKKAVKEEAAEEAPVENDEVEVKPEKKTRGRKPKKTDDEE